MSQYIDEKFVKLLRSAYKEKGNMILIYKMMQKGTQKKKRKRIAHPFAKIKEWKYN